MPQEASFDEDVADWMATAMRYSHVEKKLSREAATARSRSEHDWLQSRIDAMYVGNLDGRIVATFFD